MSDAPTEVQQFPHVEGFTIRQLLSEKGGMADVYLATQHGNEREVILKFLRDNDPDYIRRFRKEAISHSRIDHPGVVTIYTVQECDGRLFIAMEFMQGGDLSEAIKSEMAEDRIVATLKSVASALQATHEINIIHRDVKPENILFKSDGTAKLSDFGIARSVDGESLTQANTCVGTPRYMSPEQLKGADIDGRSDLYSLGLVLYEMLTGTRVFDGDSVETIFFKKVNQPKFVLDKDKNHWQAILNKLTALKPEERYQEAKDLISDLNDLTTKQATKLNWPMISGLSAVLILGSVALYTNTDRLLRIDDAPLVDTSSSIAVEGRVSGQPSIGLSSKILVPYDHEECQTSTPGNIDFVPYLDESLYENNCFAVSAKWQSGSTFYLISDVTGEGVWTRMYPNNCGNLGVSAPLPDNSTVHFPNENGQPWVFILDDNPRAFKLVSLALDENSVSPETAKQLRAIPSICDGNQSIQDGGFDWPGLREVIDSSQNRAHIAYNSMLVNHEAKRAE